MNLLRARIATVPPCFALLIMALGSVHAESLDRALLSAVQIGDAAGVEKWITEGADANFRRIGTTVDIPETTALREAVRGNHAEIMQILLKQHLDDRILSDAMRFFPYDDGDTDDAMGRIFVETLLAQGRHEILAANARHLRSESALRRVLEHGPVNDVQIMLNVVQHGSWETVMLAAAGLSGPEPQLQGPEDDRGITSTAGSMLPIALVHRVAGRLHEEKRAVELLRALSDRGVDFEVWGNDARDAATRAKQLGLVMLAEALSPDVEDLVEPTVITEEDRMASAWLHRDMETLEEFRNAGVRLKGSALVKTSMPAPVSLATVLIRTKNFDRILDGGIGLLDWENPRDNPYRAAKDFETIQWLLDHKAPFDGDPEMLFWVMLHPEPTEETIRMAEALISAGADIHHTAGRTNWTVLHSAVVHDRGNRDAAVRLLLEHGAEPERPDDAGKSARDYAEDLFKIRLLEILDPERKAGFWEKYGAADADHIAGIWSNGKDEFQTATLLMRSNGEAQLFSSVSSSPAFWRLHDGKVMLDLIDDNQFHQGKREIIESVALEHPNSDREILTWKHGKDEIVFMRAGDAAMLEQALAEANPMPEEAAIQAPDEEDLRRTGIEQMMSGNSFVSLTNWPDEDLPDGFKCAKLTALTVRGGNLKRLPGDLAERFPNLEFLVLERVPLEACPAGLDKLGKLKRLWLIGTQLEELADIRLEHLSELDLSDNRLATVPTGWFASEQLHACDLSNNRLRQPPPGLEDHPGIQRLNLSANAITGLEIGNWPELQSLDVKENHLRELSLEAERLPKLNALNLAGNRLSRLPDTLVDLPSLSWLNLSHNDLKELPDRLERIPDLKFLTIRGTLIPPERLSEMDARETGYRIEWK